MRQRTVLLIASNPQEVRLIQQTFEHAGLHHTLRVVHDGEEALAYLRQEGVYTDSRRAPRPDVIVLDLQVPRLTGQERLQCLKQDQQLKLLLIIVCTTSMCPDEVRLGVYGWSQRLSTETGGVSQLCGDCGMPREILVGDRRVAARRLTDGIWLWSAQPPGHRAPFVRAAPPRDAREEKSLCTNPSC